MPEGVGVGDVSKAAAMLDHFEKIQKLPDKLEGVPNFRRVPGYKVFCCGQPTKEGFVAAIEKACGDKWPKDGPIIWMNMRQEAIIYVNGQPVCARPANKIGEYAELGNVTRKYLFFFYLGTIQLLRNCVWGLILNHLPTYILGSFHKLRLHFLAFFDHV